MLSEALPKIITDLPGPKSQAVINKRAEAIPSSISCATPLRYRSGRRSYDSRFRWKYLFRFCRRNWGHEHRAQ